MSVSKQIIEPGGKNLMELLLGSDWFNGGEGGRLGDLFGGDGGFSLGGSLGAWRDRANGLQTPGPNLDELIGQRMLQDRVRNYGGEWDAWMHGGTGTSTEGRGLGDIQLRNEGYDLGGRGPLYSSELGQIGGSLRNQRLGTNPDGTPSYAAGAFADPAEAMGKMSSAWGQPMASSGDWLRTAQDARGGGPAGSQAGTLAANWGLQQANWNNTGPQMDQFGQRGVDQTKALTNQYEDQLNRDIDKEASLTMTDDLGEARNALASAGLGESGIGAGAMAGTYRRVLEQANRDKQRTMAQFRDANIGREAAAIGQGSQIGAQGASEAQQRMAAMLQGGMGIAGQGLESDLGRDYGAAMAGLQAQEGRYGAREQQQGSLMSQLLGDRYGSQRALAFGQMDIDQLMATEQAQANRRAQEQQAQQWAGQFGANLWQMDRGFQDSDLDRAIRANQMIRELQQNQRDSMYGARQEPLDLLSKILTGIQTAPQQRAQQSPWAGAAAGAGANYLMGLLPTGGQQQPINLDDSRYSQGG